MSFVHWYEVLQRVLNFWGLGAWTLKSRSGGSKSWKQWVGYRNKRKSCYAWICVQPEARRLSLCRRSFTLHRLLGVRYKQTLPSVPGKWGSHAVVEPTEAKSYWFGLCWTFQGNGCRFWREDVVRCHNVTRSSCHNVTTSPACARRVLCYVRSLTQQKRTLGSAWSWGRGASRVLITKCHSATLEQSLKCSSSAKPLVKSSYASLTLKMSIFRSVHSFNWLIAHLGCWLLPFVWTCALMLSWCHVLGIPAIKCSLRF